MQTRSRRIFTGLGIALLVIGSAACGGSTSADTVGLRYNGGPFEGESYAEFIEPASGRVTTGVAGDRIIRIPINKRDYTFCPEVRDNAGGDGCDGGAITVTALGGANIAFSGGLSFMINTATEESTRTFYEELCRKFDCAGTDGIQSDGWAELLRVNVRGPLEDTLQEVVRRYTVDEIYAGVPSEDTSETDDAEAQSTLTAISDEVQRAMRDTLNDFAGGDFFCGPDFDRTQGDEAECPELEFVITDVRPDDTIIESFNRNVASRQGLIDAENEAAATVTEAQAEADAAALLASAANVPGITAYLQAQAMVACAQNPECTLVVTPGSTGVNVNTGSGG